MNEKQRAPETLRGRCATCKHYITEQAAELLIKDWHYNVYSYMDDVELEKLIKKHIEDWFSGLDSEIPVSFDLI